MTLPRLALFLVGLAIMVLPASAGNREDCLQDKDQALAAIACPLYEKELAAQKQETTQPSEASQTETTLMSPAMFEQNWRLNPVKSRLSITTVKEATTTETHEFTTLDGSISPTGEAKVTIDLWSLDTKIDIRNVRMRFLFFETFKFPNAVVTAKVGKEGLQDLLSKSSMTYPLQLTLDLHGIQKDLEASVVVTKGGENAVSVASVAPIVIQAADFGLSEGIINLSKAAGGIEITPSASVTFALTFEGGDVNPQLDAARATTAAQQVQQKTRTLSPEECQTRMDVISQTRQIYFRTNSAQLNSSESAPVLDEVAQFTNRCPTVAMEISGHTDTDGSKAYNQTLSEQRARAVADALMEKGVEAGRIKTVGYGYSRPVADNNSSEGKAQNRRIEFARVGGQ